MTPEIEREQPLGPAGSESAVPRPSADPVRKPAAQDLKDAKISFARRYRIIRALLAKDTADKLTIDSLLTDRDFKRAFPAITRKDDRPLRKDFEEIAEMLAGPVSVEHKKRSGELLAWRHDRLFGGLRRGRNLEPASKDEVEAQRRDAEAKLYIGKYVVSRLLADPDEIVYLSTGTTLFQVAKALVDSDMSNIRVVLTDNLAILNLFFQKSLAKEWPPNFALQLLRGVADFIRGDIAPMDFKQLAQWDYSTAVVSATAINSSNGRIYSFRQPDTKRAIFDRMSVRRFVIPVKPEKFEARGGEVVHDPEQRTQAGREYHIVTTCIPREHKEALSRYYKVHEVGNTADGNVGS